MTALVVGATSGFGKAIAEEYHSNGYKVYGFGRNIPESSTITYIRMDVTDEQSVESALAQVFSQEDKVDVLVNCAGHGIAGPSEEIPMRTIEQTMNVNFLGTVRVIQKVLPYMRKAGGGTIVNFSSIGGIIALPFQAFYSASKYAIEAFSESLAIEVKPFGIKVVIMEPGDFKTNAARNRSVVKPPTNSVYHKRLITFFEYLDTRVDKGGDPKRLARKVRQLSEKKYPKLRYRYGSVAECVTKPIHEILPGRWWERIMQIFYGI